MQMGYVRPSVRSGLRRFAAPLCRAHSWLYRRRFIRQVVTVTEVEGEGLDAFLGKEILVFCLNYIYTGKLVGVNSSFIKLEGARLVYETGAFNTAGYKDAQALPTGIWYVQMSAIESFGAGKVGANGARMQTTLEVWV